MTTSSSEGITFSNMFVSDYNREAVSAARRVADLYIPAPHGPLCIVGGDGLGKTALLDALEHQAKNHGVFNVVRIDCNYLLQMQNTGTDFNAWASDTRAQLGLKTILLVDDIHVFDSGSNTSYTTYSTLVGSIKSLIDYVFDEGGSGRAVVTSNAWPYFLQDYHTLDSPQWNGAFIHPMSIEEQRNLANLAQSCKQ